MQLIIAGASTVAYQFTIDTKDLEDAPRCVHREFFGDGGKPLSSPPAVVPRMPPPGS